MTKRDNKIQINFSEEEKEILRKGAESRALSFSAYVRMRILKIAKQDGRDE